MRKTTSKTKKNYRNNMKKNMLKRQEEEKKRQNDIRKQAEARRKIAKRWSELGNGAKYQTAATKESCEKTALQLETELFDGIVLNLHQRNNGKSKSSKKHILQRIVEKRLAQSAHHKIKRNDSRLSTYLLRLCTSKSMRILQKHQENLFK